MQTTHFTFLSKDGKTSVHAIRWAPDDGVYHAVLQITHGMVEYIERYAPFADYMTSRGWLVVGHDHLGHGDSIVGVGDWGYFAAPRPSDTVIEDMHRLRTRIQKEEPDKPYFMLGHSMGSYMLRKYLSVYHEDLAGVIVMGTGFIPEATTKAALRLIKGMTAIWGGHYRSPFVARLTQGPSYKGFDATGAEPEKSWLTRDVEIVKAYHANPKCSFLFTLNGYQGLIEAVQAACSPQQAEKLPKDLPMLLISGGQDPVGDLGEGVRRVEALYREAGIADLTCMLYPESRHEVLNELDRDQVYEDLYNWMDVRIPKA